VGNGIADFRDIIQPPGLVPIFLSGECLLPAYRPDISFKNKMEQTKLLEL